MCTVTAKAAHVTGAGSKHSWNRAAEQRDLIPLNITDFKMTMFLPQSEGMTISHCDYLHRKAGSPHAQPQLPTVPPVPSGLKERGPKASELL